MCAVSYKTKLNLQKGEDSSPGGSDSEPEAVAAAVSRDVRARLGNANPAAPEVRRSGVRARLGAQGSASASARNALTRLGQRQQREESTPSPTGQLLMQRDWPEVTVTKKKKKKEKILNRLLSRSIPPPSTRNA